MKTVALSVVLGLTVFAGDALACRACTEALETFGGGTRAPAVAAPSSEARGPDASLQFLRRLYEMDRIERQRGRDGAEYADLSYETLRDLAANGEHLAPEVIRVAGRLYRESLANPHFVAKEAAEGGLRVRLAILEGRGRAIDVSRLEPAQRGKLETVLRLLGVEQETSGGRLRFAFTEGRDATLAARLGRLLGEADLSRPETFRAELNRVLDGLDAFIVDRATPAQIATAPFVYERWNPRLIPGSRALRNADTYVFQDPSGRVSVIHLPERPLGEGQVLPAEIEVIRIARDSEGRPVLDENQSFYKKNALGEESTRGRACLACHGLSAGGRLMSLTKRRNVEGLGVDFAGRAGRGSSVFIESEEIRGTPFSTAVRDLGNVPMLPH